MSSHSPEATHKHLEESNENGSGLGFLLPALLLILVSAGAWYLLGMDAKPHLEHATADHQEHTTEAVKEMEAAAPAAGKVDSLNNFIYETGKTVTVELPNGAGKLEVGEFSTENKLYKFLSDSNATIDTVKGNWFEFTNVKFKTGGAQIDSTSGAQLKNTAAIIKAFSKAQFKIGGYTDNSGDTAKNISLSQSRADVVLTELKKLGIAAASLTAAKGYGPEHPIGDNATKEGKAMNRRVAVNVKAK